MKCYYSAYGGYFFFKCKHCAGNFIWFCNPSAAPVDNSHPTASHLGHSIYVCSWFKEESTEHLYYEMAKAINASNVVL